MALKIKSKKPAPMLVFSLRIGEKTLKKLRKLAQKEKKTVGNLIRQTIQKFFDGEKYD